MNSFKLGIYYYANGDHYVGDWENDKFGGILLSFFRNFNFISFFF